MISLVLVLVVRLGLPAPPATTEGDCAPTERQTNAPTGGASRAANVKTLSGFCGETKRVQHRATVV